MPRGPSGRFVIELEPDIKRALHSALAAEGLTVKEWFRSHVAQYLSERQKHGLVYPITAGAERLAPRQAAEPHGTYSTPRKDARA